MSKDLQIDEPEELTLQEVDDLLSELVEKHNELVEYVEGVEKNANKAHLRTNNLVDQLTELRNDE